MDSAGKSKNNNINDKNLIKINKDDKFIAELKESIPEVDKLFTIHSKIGEGTFSSVFLASLRVHKHLPANNRKYFAIKHIIPTSHPNRIARELKCLQQIGGESNVVGIDLCLRKNESVAFVMPYLSHEKFINYYDKMSINDIKDYMKNLLITLKRVHSFNVIHRDIKPTNFLYNPNKKEYLLVDFGLAEWLNVNTNNNNLLSSHDKSKINLNNNNNCNKRKRKETDDDTDGTVFNNKNNNNNKNLNNNCNKNSKRICKENLVNGIVNNNAATSLPLPVTLLSQVAATPAAQPLLPPTTTGTINFIKSPLKPINYNKQKNDFYNSPLSTNIKSTIVGLGMHMRMQNRLISNNKLQQATTNRLNSLAAPSTASGTATNGSGASINKSPIECFCYGKSQVCNICLIRKEINVSRAGTPGYRPPEVLLKSTNQTTAIDIWSAGVIFLSILSGCYPFFKASDDLTALSEFITLFGDERVKKLALQLGRHIKISEKKQPLNLRKICYQLRRHHIDKAGTTSSEISASANMKNINKNGIKLCKNCKQLNENCLCANSILNTDFTNDIYPESAYDLLTKLLELNPNQRITAEQALEHPFLKE